MQGLNWKNQRNWNQKNTLHLSSMWQIIPAIKAKAKIYLLITDSYLGKIAIFLRPTIFVTMIANFVNILLLDSYQRVAGLLATDFFKYFDRKRVIFYQHHNLPAIF